MPYRELVFLIPARDRCNRIELDKGLQRRVVAMGAFAFAGIRRLSIRADWRSILLDVLARHSRTH